MHAKIHLSIVLILLNWLKVTKLGVKLIGVCVLILYLHNKIII